MYVFDTDFDAIIEDLQAVIDDPETDCEIVCIDGVGDLGRGYREIHHRLCDTLTPHDSQIGIIEADPTDSEIHAIDPKSDEFTGMLKTLMISDYAALARQREPGKILSGGQSTSILAGGQHSGFGQKIGNWFRVRTVTTTCVQSLN